MTIILPTSKRALPASFAAVLALPAVSHGLDYGISDARALGMGGATVATANAAQAQYYNPAMLAMYEGQEEDTRHGRVYLPTMVSQVSNSVEDVVDVLEDDLDDQLSEAITAYNADANQGTAQGVSLASRDLQSAILDIGNQDLDGEAYVGFSVSEPSHRQGGSFYFGIRAVGGGTSNVSDEDLALLDDYIETMDFAASGGTAGVFHPELFDEDGQLVDPAEDITSAATISSMSFAEWGVAFAHEFEFWGQNVSLGATPKIMRVDVYLDDLTYGDSDYDYEEDKRTHYTMNLDLGVAVPIGEHFRIALASKDIVPQTFAAGSGQSVETKARSRIGAAYEHRWVSAGWDVDLQTNEALGNERPGQETALGVDIHALPWLDVRLGYRHDLQGFRGDVLSGGIGIRAGRLVADLAYATSEDITGGGVQFGWTF